MLLVDIAATNPVTGKPPKITIIEGKGEEGRKGGENG